MPDKKLTDKEIVNCFEWVKNCNGGLVVDCIGCPLQEHYPLCEEALIDISFHEITRLKSEVESLKDLILKKCCDNCIHKEKTLRDFPCCECFGYRNFIPKNLLKTIKAEAYKECISKVQNQIKNNDAISAEWLRGYLNNLLVGLVGGDNEK